MLVALAHGTVTHTCSYAAQSDTVYGTCGCQVCVLGASASSRCWISYCASHSGFFFSLSFFRASILSRIDCIWSSDTSTLLPGSEGAKPAWPYPEI